MVEKLIQSIGINFSHIEQHDSPFTLQLQKFFSIGLFINDEDRLMAIVDLFVKSVPCLLNLGSAR
jgi:hypothetical protein